MADSADVELEEKLRSLALAGMTAFMSGGQSAENARLSTLIALSCAVATEADSEDETEQYASAAQRAVDWAAVKIEASQGSELRN